MSLIDNYPEFVACKADLANIPLSAFHALGSKGSLETGLLYLENKCLNECSYNSATKVFSASSTADSSIYFDAKWTGILWEHHCTCATHSSQRCCFHVVALVAAIYEILKAQSLGKTPMLLSYRDNIQQQWIRSLALKAKPATQAFLAPLDSHPRTVIRSKVVRPTEKGLPKQSVVVQRKKGSEWLISLYGDFDIRLVDTWGIPGDLENGEAILRKSYSYMLPPIVEKAIRDGWAVYLKTNTKEFIRLTGKTITGTDEIGFSVDCQRKEVISNRREPRTLSDAAILQIYSNFWVLLSGDFYTEILLTSNPSKAMSRKVYGVDNDHNPFYDTIYFPSLHEWTFPIAEFNRRSIVVPLENEEIEKIPLALDGQCIPVPYAFDTRDITWGIDITPASKVFTPAARKSVSGYAHDNYGSLLSQIPKYKENDWAARIICIVDGESIDTIYLFQSLFHKIFRVFDRNLLNARRRLVHILEVLEDISCSDPEEDFEDMIESLLDEEMFQYDSQYQKADHGIYQIFKEWVAEEDSLHLSVVSDPTPHWQLLKFSKYQFTRLFFSLLKATSIDSLAHQYYGIIVPNEELPFFLVNTQEIAKKCNAEVRYNGKSVQMRPVSIAVDVTKLRDLDWFELKAEVRCGSLTIAQEEWEALITGSLLLQEGEEMVMPQIDIPAALAHLQSIFGKKKTIKKKSGSIKRKEDTSVQISRLQIFDWLELRKSGAQVSLPTEVEDVCQRLQEFSGIPELRIPSTVNATLRDYQKHGFEWLAFLYEHRFGACLADDMGLGKTLQSIVFLAWRKAMHSSSAPALPHLIVVPPSLIFNWHSEIQRFCPSLTVGEYSAGDRNLQQALQHDVVLTTFDFVRKDIELFKKEEFDVVIFDEAQKLKNISAARTQSALLLKRHFTLCLTGTPMENHIGEYYSIMNLAVSGLFGDYKEFMAQINDGVMTSLNRARPFVLRRTKERILKELPPKVESDIYLDMTNEQKEIYTRTVAEVKAEVLEAYKDHTKAQAGIVALTALMRLRQVCVSPELLGKPLKSPAPKIAYLLDKLGELHEEGYSCLLFSQFTRTLDLLEDAIRREKIPYVRLDGKTPVKKRKEIVEKFQNDPVPHAFLISLKAGGVGLNLTRAQYVFHADPWWNPAVENQASDRAHRIGQKQTVFIQRVLMRHSIEEKIMELKRRKQELFNTIMGDGAAERTEGSIITREDFEFLLEP